MVFVFEVYFFHKDHALWEDWVVLVAIFKVSGSIFLESTRVVSRTQVPVDPLK